MVQFKAIKEIKKEAGDMVQTSPFTVKTLTSLGKNVRFIRGSLLNLKLNDMAYDTDISRDVLCRIEALSDGRGAMGKNRISPSLTTLIKFCEFLGIEVKDLFEEELPTRTDIHQKILAHRGMGYPDSVMQLGADNS